MKKIFLFFAAILCAMNASAYKLYLYTGKVDWTASSATFKVWTNQDVKGTKIGTNWYSFDVGTYTGTAYIKRCDPNGNKWNEFSASISSTNNFARVTDWDKGEISGMQVVGDNWNNIGNWDTKNTNGKMTISDNTFTKTFTNVSASAHIFKLTFYNTWDNAIGYGNHVSCVNGTVAADGENIKFTPAYAGDVTITYNMANGKITITCAEPKYTITATAGEGGTVTGGGTFNKNADVTLTATANDGYEFAGWSDGSKDNPYTFKATKDLAIEASFNSTIINELTVKAGIGIKSVSGSTSPVTLGESYPINATAAAGYEFSQWTAEPAENATFAAQESETQVTIQNGSVTVTATATEILSELTTANSFDKGTPELAAPTATATQIGVATSATITATAHADYTFAGWELTNCVRTDEGAETAMEITVKANGDGAAASVTAKYNIIPKVTVYAVNNAGWENMTVHHWIPDGEGTAWPGDAMTKIAEKDPNGYDVYTATFVAAHTYCIFNNSGNGKQTENLTVQDGYYYDIFGGKWYASLAEVPAPDPLITTIYLAGDMNGWNQSSTAFRKATAEGTTASVSVELDKKTYAFKIIDNGTWLGNNGTMTREYHEGWIFRNKQDDGVTDEGDAHITADLAGTYTFTWDMTNKKLTVEYPSLPVTITKSFELTPENVGNRMGRQTISVEDVDLGTIQLVIPGFNAEVSEYAEASLAIGDDESLTATATYQNDVENNKDIYTAVATSTDGSKIYNLTFNVALPTTQNYELYAMGISATVESEEGLTTYYLKGNAILGEEYVPVEFMLDNSGYTEGTIGEVFAVGTGEAEQEDTSLYGVVLLQDESGNTYRIEFTAEVEQPEVEIVVKEEVNVVLYNLTIEPQGTMALVSAGTEELSFYLTLLNTENHYGDYTHDAFSNIWYGEDQLYAAYGDTHVYAEVDGKAKFVVSFISIPDAEGNVTKYNFALYAGKKPSDPTALENLTTTIAPVKAIVNGQLVIIKNGVQYNAQGQVVK